MPIVIRALRAVTPKLDWWLQEIPGTTSEISVQKNAILGTAKILCRTLRLPSGRGPELQVDSTTRWEGKKFF